jgi:hypothetical protein
MANKHSTSGSPPSNRESSQQPPKGSFLLKSSLSLRLFMTISIGVVIVMCIYFAWLLLAKADFSAYRTPPPRSTDPKEIEKAQALLKSILDENSKGFVVSTEDVDDKLHVKVDGKKWKALTYDGKKQIIKDIASARETLGKFPRVVIEDHKNSIEYGSYSSHRVLLAEDEM